VTDVLRVPVHRRFSDLDPLGHVNNVVFHDYLQEARVALIGDLSLISGTGTAQVVVTQDIRYVRPLLFGREPIVIETWVTRIGGSSYGLAYRILDENGECVAEAASVLATVDETTGRPTRIGEQLRSTLEPLLVEAEPSA
jgi:acyl-CoA thioester hydrolase